MNYVETAIQFNCSGERLVGITSLPKSSAPTDTSAPKFGLLIIVGGPQYRAGSHRQFVLLARAVANAGVPTLRFDYRGMGDSTGTLHNFEQVNNDIAAAIDSLQAAVPSVQQVALWGLCDGASAALLYCHETQDARVTGLCLLNPWVRSEASLAKTQIKHYYLQRLRQREFWEKLLSGKVARRAASELFSNTRAALSRPASAPMENGAARSFQNRMALGWSSFKGSLLLILSDTDFTAKEFADALRHSPTWSGATDHPNLRRQDLPFTDHTFSDVTGRKLVEETTIDWILQHAR